MRERPAARVAHWIALPVAGLLLACPAATAATQLPQLLAQAPSAQEAEAERLLKESIQLSQQGTASALIEALEKLTDALPLWQAAGNPGKAADTLLGMGRIYEILGKKEKAIEYYNRALPLQREAGDAVGEATVLNNLGSAYEALGEKQKALDYYRSALALYREAGDRPKEAGALNNLGLVYQELGEVQKSLDYFQQALPLYRAAGDRGGEGIALSNMGAAYEALGKPQQALDYYEQALPLSQEAGDAAAVATTLNNLGGIYSALGQQQKALDYYQKALPLYQALGNRTGVAAILNNLGTVSASLGQAQKAVDYYNQVLPLDAAVGDRAGEATTRFNLAYLHKKQGNLPEALNQMEAAIKIVEDLRTKIASPELRTSYFGTMQDFYELYIDLLMELHQKDPSQGYDALALHASERSRARSLLELLKEANTDIRQGVEPQLVEQERRLQGELDAVERERVALYSGNPTPEERAALEQRRASLLDRYRTLQAQIRATSPRYAALTQPQPLTLNEIQQQVLDGDTLLLQYSLGRERSYAWVVTAEGISSQALPPRDQITQVAREFYETLQYDWDRPEKVAATANALSQAILKPLAGKLNAKRLLIVADGALQYVPFAALPVPGQEQPQLAVPLISQYEIVNSPSSSTLAVLREEVRGRQPAPKTLAIFADPVFSATDERVKQPPPVGQKGSAAVKQLNPQGQATRDVGVWDRLPGTRREAEAIISLLPESERLQVFDFDANLAAATSPQLKQYRIVHLATHGLLDSQSPELSGLVLSLVDAKGRPQNGFLRLHEVFNLPLQADLVVLSACETGLGKEVKGEGLIGLTRGFMYAGSPRVIVSLWSVSDEATAEMMVRFYRHLLEDQLPAADALRAAQLEMVRETQWKSPYFWSAFTLQGEWR